MKANIIPYILNNVSSRVSRILITMTFLVSSCLFGCKKLVDIDMPVDRTTADVVFNDDVTATAVLTGLYAQISQTRSNASTGLPLISNKTGLSSDELSLWNGAGNNDFAFYTNALFSTSQLSSGSASSIGHEFWTLCYGYLYTCNSAIEGLNEATLLTPSVKKQLLGEAKFMRAFLFFYLLNLYGDVPLTLSTDYKQNSTMQRSPKSSVYQQIIIDLREAQSLLNTVYLDANLKEYASMPERVRPTMWAATALLARVYLYSSDFVNAEAESTKIINNISLFGLSPLNDVFLANSGEAIWQLQPVNTGSDKLWNTEDARLYVLNAAPTGLSSSKPVYLSQQLLSAFEPGDGRFANWVGSFTNSTGTYFFPYKYKVATTSTSITEYRMVLRLGEQFLIRAEARAQQNKTGEGLNDLNTIRSRASLSPSTANDKSALLNAILNERRIELFTEWGHRWLDLKRTSNVDAVMSTVTPLKYNGAVWNSYKQWYPVPINDIERNPNLIQNQGY